MPDKLAPDTGSLGGLLAYVRNELRSAGMQDAGREARQLIVALLGVAPEAVLCHPEMAVGTVDRKRMLEALSQRLKGVPIGRIAGVRAFYGREFHLGSETLEPRPDSEVLIEAALEIIADAEWREKPLRIIDVGTGTGCLLITLLAELPNASGVGIDISAGALAVARANAQRYGVAARATFAKGDMLDGVVGPFDLMISNPPYIRSSEIAGLDIGVRGHDPRAALDGGPDGMTFYRRIGADVARVVPDGWMLLEVGAGMADAVCLEIDSFDGQNFKRDWKMWLDLNGHKRCVAAKTLVNRQP